MREFMLSTGDHPTIPAFTHGKKLAVAGDVGRPNVPLLLNGSNQIALAAIAAWTLAAGHTIVLQPDGVTPTITGLQVVVEATSAHVTADGGTCGATRPAWQVAMYTSGSTRTARAYGFSLRQLDLLAAWYTTIYRVTNASAVITHLPVAYNFTFVAGVYLAATCGGRLHLADSPTSVFADAARLARTHDRCVILGNPVLLADAPQFRLPENVLIDSGGAPLSTTAINHYREHVADLREGYGLTETGSLTHFDTQATPASLGTVGTAMPQVTTTLVNHDGQPRIAVTTPALGTPVTGSVAATGAALVTEDVGALDPDGHLRILGRCDDHPVGGLWPRDTLDAIGGLLGTGCALIRHPSPCTVHVRLHRPRRAHVLNAVRACIAELTNIPPSAITVDTANQTLLHSHKLRRPTLASPEG
jgi:hypothetical protein